MKDRIYQVMSRAGLSQKEFANRLGLAQASISGIFTGRSNPTNNHVQAIHRAFPEVSVEWLMFGEGDMYVPSVGAKFIDGDNVSMVVDGEIVPLGTMADSAVSGMGANGAVNGMPMSADSSAANNMAAGMGGATDGSGEMSLMVPMGLDDEAYAPGMSGAESRVAARGAAYAPSSADSRAPYSPASDGRAPYSASDTDSSSGSWGRTGKSRQSSGRASRSSGRTQPTPEDFAIVPDAPMRRIKEIRVFYDGGMYETFVPAAK